MNAKSILAKAIEVVAFLFAAFGHFLVDVAPPEEANASFAVGIGSLFTLCVLLFIASIAKNLPRAKHKKRWLTASGVFFVLAVTAAFSYQWNYGRYTFTFPPEQPRGTYMAGTRLTPLAEEIIARDTSGTMNTSELVANMGGVTLRERVWVAASIRKAELILVANYIVFLLSFASAIFCLIEGILSSSRRQPSESHG